MLYVGSITGSRKPFVIRACQDAGSPSTVFGACWWMRALPFFVVGYPDHAPRAAPSIGAGDVPIALRQSLIARFLATAQIAFCAMSDFTK